MPRVHKDHIREIRENVHKTRENQRKLYDKIEEHQEQHTRFQQRIDSLNKEIRRHKSRFFWLLGGIGTTLITALTILVQALIGGN